jgi:cell division transport system ATP-binding protein
MDNLILKDVNLNIDKGEFVYPIGKLVVAEFVNEDPYGDIPLKKGQGSIVDSDLSAYA